MRHATLLLMLLSLFSSLFSQQKEEIRSVFFGGGSAYIDNQQASELRAFVQSYGDLTNVQISISSHTDNIGGTEYNQWLSEMRSESVIQQLEKNNVPRDRVGRIDNGQNNPLYDNRSLKGRMANRRVDIIFTPLFL